LAPSFVFVQHSQRRLYSMEDRRYDDVGHAAAGSRAAASGEPGAVLTATA
jgi:hypothetical protein